MYRNLEALERLGLIRHVHLGHGPGLYARIGLGPLEYLLCDSCGAHLAVESVRAGPGPRGDPRTVRLPGAVRALPDRRAVSSLRGRRQGVSFDFLFTLLEELDGSLTGLFEGAPLLVAIGVAVLLGLRHASDPDHLVAVTSLIASDDRDTRAAARLTAWWGLGHAAILLLIGLPLILLKSGDADLARVGCREGRRGRHPAACRAGDLEVGAGRLPCRTAHPPRWTAPAPSRGRTPSPPPPARPIRLSGSVSFASWTGRNRRGDGPVAGGAAGHG